MTRDQEPPPEEEPGARPVRLVDSLQEKGLALLAAGRLDEAERTFVQALDIVHRELGPNELAINYANLGALYAGKGYHPQAERMYLAALTVFEAIPAPAHPRLADVRGALAKLKAAADRGPDPRR